MSRPSASRRGYGRGWQAVTRDAVATHRRVFGDTCPGWERPAHWSADLTGDHVIPISAGGLSTRANVQVLCRACNARKSNALPPRVQLDLGLDATTQAASSRSGAAVTSGGAGGGLTPLPAPAPRGADG